VREYYCLVSEFRLELQTLFERVEPQITEFLIQIVIFAATNDIVAFDIANVQRVVTRKQIVDD
jgi:hypothetical protein